MTKKVTFRKELLQEHNHEVGQSYTVVDAGCLIEGPILSKAHVYSWKELAITQDALENLIGGQKFAQVTAA